MYVHLGGDLVVLASDIVTVLDVRLLETSEDVRRLVDRAAREGYLRGNGITHDCKALVITSVAIYPSTVSTLTLAKRIASLTGNAALAGGEIAQQT